MASLLSPNFSHPPQQPQVEFFSNEVMVHPVANRPEHKRSFIPSLLEKEKVSKLVHAIKMGWIQPRRVKDPERDQDRQYYDLWTGDDPSILARHKMHLPAPKMALPGHHESYNPPPEYLFTEQEVADCLSTWYLFSEQEVSVSPSVYFSTHLSPCSGPCGSSRTPRTGSSPLFPRSSLACGRFLHSPALSTRGLSAASTSTCVPARGR